ncbi:MAG: 3-deoxy-manno-octulosonate cytidylyltransferase [Candidatus Cloacimonetes bacterium]|jgi:3-deoxy-manno-octulosonate cytidylyltransferase (CMP-KDO synthetase)|nr:3-deoxy-manno-octulosonate cytidylyltransferase [Candidatus Cloacimonadota bacterium]MDD4157048.1 3-deoxy-manno-octulosonate cytidylyltransferase [Candidatus Cloacimonadota bacterium]
MHITAIIPARMSSTRLPGKPLIKIHNKTLIQRVYEAVKKTKLFDEIFIATDSEEIFNHINTLNAKAVMTSINHNSGTDRVYECLNNLKKDTNFKTDLIINVQGDEPFISKKELQPLISVFKDNNVVVASLMYQIEDRDEISNPNNVKVVINSDNDAIYFSRSVIPFNRDSTDKVKYYKHIGVYAYRPEALKTFINLNQSILENIEKLEQLRFIENNIPIKMILTDYKGIGIDTPQDLKNANMLISDDKD